MSRVFLLCSGLGHVLRGYESFTQECFEALSDHPDLEITLFQGGKTSIKNAITLGNLPRNHALTQHLATRLSKASPLGDPYFLEQASFCLSLIPHLWLKRPDVVFFSDFALGTMLWHWRRISNLSYKLLFSNGAPNGPPFSRMDHVQHLTPIHYQTALNAGEPASHHSLVPYGIQTSREYTSLTQAEQHILRHRLNLPVDRPVILSVGAINKTHKRMDYLIQEVARLPEPHPYLVLLGQTDNESSEVVQLGNQLLGTHSFQVKTVSPTEMANYYKAADLFVLTSLSEGFGRVFLEAMGHGLPCLAHDYEVTRFVLGETGYLANLEQSGNLSGLIHQTLVEGTSDLQRRLRHRYVYEHFSWEQLRPGYVEMIQRCVLGNDGVRSLSQPILSPDV
jgi:glycosyltransferase involved in cell wall biosynthesis